MSATAKRIGRPFKPPSGKRAQLTLLVRAHIKREIDKAAQKSGRTQSQEAELWFETKLAYDCAFKAMGKTATEIQRGNLEAALFRAGYTVERIMIDGRIWKSWREPGYPAVVNDGAVVSGLASEEESR
jgi:hypothetical protein